METEEEVEIKRGCAALISDPGKSDLSMKQETAPAIFRETVKKYGDRVAMRKKEYGLWHDISWNDYYCQATYVGCAMVSMGLEKGDCVSIIGDNCPEWIMADMGTQCVGG